MSEFAVKPKPNAPPLEPLPNSPFALSGNTSYTINFDTGGDDLVVIIRETNTPAFEQLGFRINGTATSDYYYRDASGATTGSGTDVPLTADHTAAGTVITANLHNDGAQSGGHVRPSSDGVYPPTAPAVGWRCASNPGGNFTSIELFNRQGTGTLNLVVEVYTRP